ncbi:hypothetical protein PFISCL1PPCAC_5748 [Pristionchus fissidentatus]|uniref:BZIP domain-containing protein n=1 Tax=Pristionchus fissidentatus TaxID=1538716 RepID=A0AAV5V6U4_9BILA|nr:hypothetical protein PFISCL1PPCAC_5748 [Pristionchus fissidentatus]
MSFMKSIFGKGKKKEENEEQKKQMRSKTDQFSNDSARRSIHVGDLTFDAENLPSCYQSVGKRYPKGPRSCPGGSWKDDETRSIGAATGFGGSKRNNTRSVLADRNQRYNIDSPEEPSYQMSRKHRSERRSNYHLNSDQENRFEDAEKRVTWRGEYEANIEQKYRHLKRENRQLKEVNVRLNLDNERLKMEKENDVKQFRDVFTQLNEEMNEKREMKKELETLRAMKVQWNSMYSFAPPPSSFNAFNRPSFAQWNSIDRPISSAITETSVNSSFSNGTNTFPPRYSESSLEGAHETLAPFSSNLP